MGKKENPTSLPFDMINPVKPEAADWTDLYRATKDLNAELTILNGMVGEVAKARVIKETDSDRRKQALARGVVRAGVESVAKGEVAARTDQRYLDDIQAINDDLLMAEQASAKWVVSQAKVDALRTLISAAKETFRNA